MIASDIEYYSPISKHKGTLYNYHFDEFTGEWNYSMSIKDENGKEVMHAYNSTPKNINELMDVVDSIDKLKQIMEAWRE